MLFGNWEVSPAGFQYGPHHLEVHREILQRLDTKIDAQVDRLDSQVDKLTDDVAAVKDDVAWIKNKLS